MSADGKDGWQRTTLPCGHEVLDANQVHYCDYISLGVLEKLGRPFAAHEARARSPHAHDETLFVVVHQVCELAFGQATDALLTAIKLLDTPLDSPEFKRGTALVSRATKWIETASSAMTTLKTMTQFQDFRGFLAPASGAESINVRRVEILAGLRAETPYVTEREQPYTYREFLDRTPGPGPNEPKTRWWTADLDTLLAHPTLLDRLQSLLAREQLSLSNVYRISFEAEYGAISCDEDDVRVEPCQKLYALCSALYALEEAYRHWRSSHHGLTVAHVGQSAGTGHTTGAPYLRSVGQTVVLFPELTRLHQQYRR